MNFVSQNDRDVLLKPIEKLAHNLLHALPKEILAANIQGSIPFYIMNIYNAVRNSALYRDHINIFNLYSRGWATKNASTQSQDNRTQDIICLFELLFLSSIHQNCFTCTKYLLDNVKYSNYPSINTLLYSKNLEGLNPLHLAARNKNQDCIDLILSYDVNTAFQQDLEGKRPLHSAILAGANRNILNSLFLQTLYTAVASSTQQNILHFAVLNYHFTKKSELFDTIIAFIVNEVPEYAQTLITQIDHKTCTPLCLAVFYSQLQSAQSLLNIGGNPNIYWVNLETHRKEMLLQTAITNNNLSMTALLLQYGANPCTLDSKQATPLHAAAVHDEQGEIIQLLLQYDGIDINAVDYKKRTVLHKAIRYNHINTVELMLKAGMQADCSIADYKGFTPLHTAVLYYDSKGNSSITTTLIERLEKNKYLENLSIPDKEGYTPLHLAFRERHPSFLLKKLFAPIPEAIAKLPYIYNAQNKKNILHTIIEVTLELPQEERSKYLQSALQVINLFKDKCATEVFMILLKSQDNCKNTPSDIWNQKVKPPLSNLDKATTDSLDALYNGCTHNFFKNLNIFFNYPDKSNNTLFSNSDTVKKRSAEEDTTIVGPQPKKPRQQAIASLEQLVVENLLSPSNGP